MLKNRTLQIPKLLNQWTISKLVTIKWMEVNDLWSSQYFAIKNRRFKAPILRPSFCDYNDAYVFAKGAKTVAVTSVNNLANKDMVFENNAWLKSMTHS